MKQGNFFFWPDWVGWRKGEQEMFSEAICLPLGFTPELGDMIAITFELEMLLKLARLLCPEIHSMCS